MKIFLEFEEINQHNGRAEGRVAIRTFGDCHVGVLHVACVQEQPGGTPIYWGAKAIDMQIDGNEQTGWLVPFSFVLKAPAHNMLLGETHLSFKEQESRQTWRDELTKAAGKVVLEVRLDTDKGCQRLAVPFVLE